MCRADRSRTVARRPRPFKTGGLASGPSCRTRPTRRHGAQRSRYGLAGSTLWTYGTTQRRHGPRRRLPPEPVTRLRQTRPAYENRRSSSLTATWRITLAYAGSTGTTAGRPRRTADHPRVRGEHAGVRPTARAICGSPPRTRGALDVVTSSAQARRITPAYAGSTGTTGPGSTGRRDHPRVRGEHVYTSDNGATVIGSPPRTRGALWRDKRRWRRVRITPAYAGSTVTDHGDQSAPEDHPRVRGEHLVFAFLSAISPGSPPRTRGAHFLTCGVKDQLARSSSPCPQDHGG